MGVEDQAGASGDSERPKLAALLSDQFAVIDDSRPVDPRVTEREGEMVFTFDWTLTPADVILHSARPGSRLREFRSQVLELVAPTLSELVELEARRTVVACATAVDDDPCRITVRFELGEPVSDDGERFVAMLNWSRQIRGQSRRRRALSRDQREEVRRLREEVAKRVAEARSRHK